ncbi:unnamed protein product [Ectocarpus sp. CCAP 1310/34]|nr:unnamed protein product [Ectocarpus sp. CCAP 1310/34]
MFYLQMYIGEVNFDRAARSTAERQQQLFTGECLP